jgi:undecaprenyl-diphosphatase
MQPEPQRPGRGERGDQQAPRHRPVPARQQRGDRTGRPEAEGPERVDPAGIAGALAEDWITKKLGTPALIAISLMVFGLVLVWADRQTGTRDLDSFSTRDALLIGAAQVLALNPGTSRSGITITAARKFGFSRDAAARVSFLMSVPVIGGAVLLKLTKLASDGIPDGLLIPMVAGIISAGISGWIAMWGMIRLLRSRSFTPFVMYRFVAGIAVLTLLSTSFR